VDLNAYWQEHKRFLIALGAGAGLFLIAWMAIAAFFGDELTLLRRRQKSLQADLTQPLHSSSDLAALQADNEALERVFAELSGVVEFSPREDFALRPGDAASSRYFGVASDVRDDLMTRCGRAGLAFPEDLGLPKLAPTREQEIARYLEALDVIDATLTLGIEAGLERVDRLQIDLDPRLASNRPIEGLEKTLIELRLSGAAPPMVALLGLLQAGRGGRSVLVERAELHAARAGGDDARLDLVLSVAHLHGLAEPPEKDG
jgi:hypothetical protein